MSLQELAELRQQRLQKLKKEVRRHDVSAGSESREVAGTDPMAALQPQLDILKKRTDESIKRLVRRRVMEEYTE